MITLQLLAIANRAPKYIDEAVNDYLGRLPKQFINIETHDIKLAKRGSGIPYQKAVTDETSRLLAKIPDNHKIIMLDRTGKSVSTEKLAKRLHEFQQNNQSLTIAIGGPEGFSKDTLSEHADEVWSLSALTMAHPVVKVVLSEQIFRAYAILTNHPYHRGQSFQ